MDWMMLAIAGVSIIGVLAAYAGLLLFKLRKQLKLQVQQQKLAIDKRNANIFENVRILCLAGIQGQCDLSEISIRVYHIMDYVQGEERVNFDHDFPATAELFHLVKDMPRGDARQAMVKKARMQDNLTRHKAEARLNDAIVEELKRLLKHVQPLNTQINVQMV